MTATTERKTVPIRGDETTQVLAWLDFHRDTLRMKCEGLDSDQLAATLPPSTLTLGGLMKHMALVEENWFSVVMLGEEQGEPWSSVDWDADPDWDFHSAFEDSPEELRRLFDDAVAASDRITKRLIAEGGLDTESVRESRRQTGHISLRWVLLHMIEEYARHNGHADLIRESVDGSTGD